MDGLPGQLSSRLADLGRLVLKSVFGQNNRAGLETVRFYYVRAGFEVAAMDAENHVGASNDEILVTAFEAGSAEISGRESCLLNGSPHGAVQHEYPLGQQAFE